VIDKFVNNENINKIRTNKFINFDEHVNMSFIDSNEGVHAKCLDPMEPRTWGASRMHYTLINECI
jgi:hypothetical protein